MNILIQCFLYMLYNSPHRAHLELLNDDDRRDPLQDHLRVVLVLPISCRQSHGFSRIIQ